MRQTVFARWMVGALAIAALGACGGGSLEGDLKTVCDLAGKVCPDAGCPPFSTAAKALDAGLEAATPASSIGRELFIALRAGPPTELAETAARAASYEGLSWSCPALERFAAAGELAAHGFGPVLDDAKKILDKPGDLDAVVDEITRFVSRNEERFAKVSEAFGRDGDNRQAALTSARAVGARVSALCDAHGLDKCGVIAQALTTLLSRCSPKGAAGHPILMLNDGARPMLMPELDDVAIGERDLATLGEGVDAPRLDQVKAVAKALLDPMLGR